MSSLTGSIVGVFALLNFLVTIAVVVTVVAALWRGMKAQEAMARHLESITSLLSERGL